MVKQYRVVVDPSRLKQFGIPLQRVKMAIKQNNAETGGAVVEMAEAEYMVRATGYIQGLDDLKKIVLKADENGTPVTLAEVAHFETGPQLRRGIAELDGEGEVAGAVVLMRYGENALTTIERVKQKQFIVVALVCAVFLFHLRSALVIVLSLPLGILLAFIVMQKMGMRHCHRHWRHGGRGHRDAGNGTQTVGKPAAGGNPLAGDCRGIQRSWAGAVFFLADYYPEFYAGVFSGSTGRPPV